MSAAYVIAIFSTRVIGILTLVVLLHLMPAKDFGSYSLINTNALAIYMVFGAWANSVAVRALVNDKGLIDRHMFSTLAGTLALLVSILIVSVGFGTFFFHLNFGYRPLLTVLLGSIFIFYEVTLAVTNAVGREWAYASISVCRYFSALFLSGLMVLLGFGVAGVVAGVAFSAILAVVLQPTSRAIWSKFQLSFWDVAKLRPYLAFGVGGGVQLGSYILINAPTRNLAAAKFGMGQAGMWAFSNDLLYGPLALVANAYALTHVRRIYLAASRLETDMIIRQSTQMLNFCITISMIYIVGTLFFANDVIYTIVSAENVDFAVSVARAAGIQGAAIVVLYCLVTFALARGQVLFGIMMVFSTASCAALCAFLGPSLEAMAWISALTTLLGVIAWTSFVVLRDWVVFEWGYFARLTACVLCFIFSAFLLLPLTSFSFGWVVNAIASSIVFMFFAYKLQLDGLILAVPFTFGGSRRRDP